MTTNLQFDHLHPLKINEIPEVNAKRNAKQRLNSLAPQRFK